MVRFYDEKVYLNNNEEALEIIESHRKDYEKRVNFTSNYFKEEIEEYKIFLEKVKEILLEFKIKNPIELSILLSNLIKTGYFSITDDFTYNYNLKNEIQCNLGINVLYGEGCCRNISAFFREILRLMEIEVDDYYCNSSYRKINFGRFNNVSHVVNLIHINDRIYGYDPANMSLLYFVNKYELKELKKIDPKYLIYKPYFSIVTGDCKLEDIKNNYDLFLEESKKKHISFDEYDNFYRESYNKLNIKNAKILKQFKMDTMELKKNIFYEVDNKFKKYNKEKNITK